MTSKRGWTKHHFRAVQRVVLFLEQACRGRLVWFSKGRLYLTVSVTLVQSRTSVKKKNPILTLFDPTDWLRRLVQTQD